MASQHEKMKTHLARANEVLRRQRDKAHAAAWAHLDANPGLTSADEETTNGSTTT